MDNRPLFRDLRRAQVAILFSLPALAYLSCECFPNARYTTNPTLPSTLREGVGRMWAWAVAVPAWRDQEHRGSRTNESCHRRSRSRGSWRMWRAPNGRATFLRRTTLPMAFALRQWLFPTGRRAGYHRGSSALWGKPVLSSARPAAGGGGRLNTPRGPSRKAHGASSPTPRWRQTGRQAHQTTDHRLSGRFLFEGPSATPRA